MICSADHCKVRGDWRRALGLVLVVASATLLGACSHLKTKPLNTDFSERNWAIRRSTLLAVENFSLQGRLSESGLTGVRGELNWTQTGRQFEIHFYGPLGVGAATISGDPRSVQIRTKDGTYVTDHPESLMQEKLGWSLPLEKPAILAAGPTNADSRLRTRAGRHGAA